MKLKDEDAILQRVIFEITYRHGFKYLDVCGSTLNALQKESPEWIISAEANPQGASLVSLSNGCVLSFSSNRLNLSLERPTGDGALSDEDFNVFIKQLDAVPELILDCLGINDFSRMGFRAFYLVPMKSMEESERWLYSLGAYTFSATLVQSLGGSVESSSALVTVLGKAAKYRVSFAGVERKAQIDFGQGVLNIQARTLPKGQQEHLKEQMRVKRRMRQNPEFAAQLDIDCSVDDPREVEGSKFVRECMAEYSSALEQALS